MQLATGRTTIAGLDSERQMRAGFRMATLVLCLVGASSPAWGVTIDWVTIGDAGNFGGPETYGRVFGAVSYVYRIDKYEVTNRQYVDFLNAKDAMGTNLLALFNTNMSTNANGGILFDAAAIGGAKYSVKSGYDNHPVNYVSWFDAARFVNWLGNGQGNADTESGAYTLQGGTPTPSNAKTITRSLGASFALPSEDEWYKAAFYDPQKPGGPGYWTYPTASDVPPTSAPPSATPNSANILGNGFAMTPGIGNSGSDVQPGIDYLVDVGAYSGSASAYGTFDQAGSVWEWNEVLLSTDGSAGIRGNQGGSFYTRSNLSTNLGWAASNAYVQEFGLGFRVVSIRDPNYKVGDFDNNGLVDFTDLNTLLSNYGLPGAPSVGDSDESGLVDFTDLNITLTHYGQSVSEFTRLAAVPEPKAFVLVLPMLGVLALALRRQGFHQIAKIGLMTAIVACWGVVSARATPIDWVPVGDIGNFDGPEANGKTFGGVAYGYSIGKYEVNNNQYADFLNAKDPTGANAIGLYNANMTSHASGGIFYNAAAEAGSKYTTKSGQGNKPVNFVTWFDSIRFTNWLNNGQGNADTETGAYTLLGGTATPSNARTIVRNSGAKIALPSEDEWHKAAYYDPTKTTNEGYWLYPTRSDDPPNSAMPPGGPNTANMRGNGFVMTPGVGQSGVDILTTVDYLTEGGAYTQSASYYGTFDQSGNVFEWNEQFLMPNNTNPAGVRGVRGGSFFNETNFENSTGWAASTASVQNVSTGLRVVSVAAAYYGPGDASCDGLVDFTDLNMLLTNYGLRGIFTDGDFNTTGTVDFDDLNILLTNYGQAAIPPNFAIAVPEPTSLLLSLAIIFVVSNFIILRHGRCLAKRLPVMPLAVMNQKKCYVAWTVTVSLCMSNSLAAATIIDWVPVGDVGNFDGPESYGKTFGGVDYGYNIGKYEVTNNQFTDFLNAKDPTGANTLFLYNPNMTSHASGGINYNAAASTGSKYASKAGQGNKPVNFVNWYDAVRFTNWLNNGQGNADTETGAYTLLGGTIIPSDGKLIVRNAGAKIALPTEDEWHKAAYYDPTKTSNDGYWLYPTRSDSPPNSAAPPGGANDANVIGNGFVMTPGVGVNGVDILTTVDYLTEVGAYNSAKSYYGAYDMAGNLIEWNEALFFPENANAVRGVRGGAFFNENTFSTSLGWAASGASGSNVSTGFRVVSVAAAYYGPGDASCDGLVDFTDLNMLLTNYGLRGIFTDGDFNTTGTVDFEDLNILLTNYGQPATAQNFAAAVPEPTSQILIAAAVSALGFSHMVRNQTGRICWAATTVPLARKITVIVRREIFVS